MVKVQRQQPKPALGMSCSSSTSASNTVASAEQAGGRVLRPLTEGAASIQGEPYHNSRTLGTLQDAANAYAKVRWQIKAGSVRCCPSSPLHSSRARWRVAPDKGQLTHPLYCNARQMLLSSTLVFFGLAVWMLAEFAMHSGRKNRMLIKVVAAIISLGGFPVSAFGVIPTDEEGVRFLRKFLAGLMLFFALVFSVISARLFYVDRPFRAYNSSKWNVLFLWNALAAIGFIGYSNLAALAPLPPRAQLAAVWATGHKSGNNLSVLYACYSVSSYYLDPTCDVLRVCGLLAMAAAIQAYRVLTSPSRVQKIQTWLQELGQLSPASVALGALLGPKTATEALEHGKVNFHAVPFSALSEAIFRKDQHSAILDARSRGQTIALGECDAFISHSWHDDSQPKWAVLCGWAKDFKRRHGREPSVWLDSVCVDQTDVADKLAGLPVYLSGCRELLVLAGPTYLGRLWCLVEVYTFLTVGGQREKVTILPCGTIDPSFDCISTSKARCSDDKDYQRLCSVMERSPTFEASLRQLFSTTGSSDACKADSRHEATAPFPPMHVASIEPLSLRFKLVQIEEEFVDFLQSQLFCDHLGASWLRRAWLKTS